MGTAEFNVGRKPATYSHTIQWRGVGGGGIKILLVSYNATTVTGATKTKLTTPKTRIDLFSQRANKLKFLFSTFHCP